MVTNPNFSQRLHTKKKEGGIRSKTLIKNYQINPIQLISIRLKEKLKKITIQRIEMENHRCTIFGKVKRLFF